ncbi:MAG: class I tRNA ligase family protein, partial [Acidobacteria bacterium]|nr:class I tRNA ligase family protein [Acidobacteriota bacterium]
IAVHPDFEYSAIEVSDTEVFIVASELARSFAETAGFAEYEEIARFKGSKLDRMEARHAWLDRTSLIMNGEHVTLGEADAEVELDVRYENKAAAKSGTGCVHTAPGHGADDFHLAKQYGLEIYTPVDAAGRFTSEVEHFAGENIFDANPKIIEYMRESGALVFSEKYQHRYPHCWRCKNPVVFRATPQWFITMDEVRDIRPSKSLRIRALEEIKQVKWHPAWGEDRLRNMFTGRPDWCVSRQRSWGVPIPVFYCAGCDGAVADPAVIDHVADIFAKETADAWYARKASELLPENFKCGGCGGREFRKETDILDVWFDSGSSCVAVLETRGDVLRFPADVYLEGGDQYRGWFNSSLSCGIAAHGEAPYKQIITHGWVVDGEGKKQSKSLGNVTAPQEIIDKSGAEILRLWAAAVDYTEDVRCSDEILSRVVDAYRKMRVLAGYEAYDFQAAYNALYNFCTVTLSARYFDIIKDRLYIRAPKSAERRSAQTTLYRIADELCRLLAPILVFTSDEAWENLPGPREASVHVAEFAHANAGSQPAAVEDTQAGSLRSRWERIFAIRDDVLRALEEARGAKTIGSSLEAKVILTTEKDTTLFLADYFRELRYIFIVSQVEVQEGDTVNVEVQKADGQKCERCWNYSVRVGEFEKYSTVCERCSEALGEIEKAAAA